LNAFIEELALNTWPAEQTLLLNGWLLRYASGYTKRSNSVNPLHFREGRDVYGSIQLAEEFFASVGLDSVFKITPFAVPGDLDRILEQLGYAVVDPSSMMLLDLEKIPEPTLDTVIIESQVNEEWMDRLAFFNHLSEEHRNIAERLLAESTLQQGFATVYRDHVPVACGLGVVQHRYIGLYDIVTHDRYRRQGFGEQLILHLLKWGRAHGATHSFLQVVQRNEPALSLYQKLGYQAIYSYWYRVKKI